MLGIDSDRNWVGVFGLELAQIGVVANVACSLGLARLPHSPQARGFVPRFSLPPARALLPRRFHVK